MKCYLKKQDGKFYDITKLIKTASIENEINNVKKVCTLNLLDNKNNQLLPLNPVSEGDHIKIIDGITVFEGIIVSKSESSRGSLTATCYDFGFYLEANQYSFYYEEVSVIEVLNDVFSNLNLNLTFNYSKQVKITKFFKGEKISDIMNYCFEKVLDATGDLLFLEVKEKEFIISVREKKDPRKITLSHFDQVVNLTDLITTKNSSSSITDMKNSIVVNKYSEKNVETLATSSDTKNIESYGKLQKVVEYATKEENSPESVAKNLLSELNVVKTTLNLSFARGDVSLTNSSVLSLVDEEIGLNGNYEIIKIIFSYENDQLRMSLNLKEV